MAPALRLALAVLLACAGACIVPVEIGTGWPDGGPPDAGPGDDAGADAGPLPDAGAADASVPLTGARFCLDPHTCKLVRDDGGVAPTVGGHCGSKDIGPNCMCSRDSQGRPEALACGSICIPDSMPMTCTSNNCGDITCLAPAVCSQPGQCG